MTLDLPAIRVAEEADLAALPEIEAEGDRRFDDLFGETGWDLPRTGRDRARDPGFLMVAGVPVAGFAHVVEEQGGAHLEQIAVRTALTRRGIGSALIEACCAEAAARGHTELTLTTYADVPWNAPYYARLGFVEVARPTGNLGRHLSEEVELERHGRRVGMVRRIKG
ncbi:GNAT family N-acetyltransferase [Nocardioides jensenii]|uniref:GNAT family N-acetyltransferase n=1 Tax=Nocardioides jensenii TaxID=1843 RepID=UPI00082AD642|nr:GNAT family N-acetyltransferase [Nocardioides jensenii]